MFRPFPLFVGLRYTRAKRRNHFISFISLISVLGIVLGVTALITVLSVMNGFQTELRNRILGMTAHVTVTNYGEPLRGWEKVASLASQNREVVGAAPYIQKEGMLIEGGRVNGVVVQGILPSREGQVSLVGRRMVAGKLANLKPGGFGIVLGRDLARSLGVKMGDKVTLITPTANVSLLGAMPRLRRFTVVGLFQVGMYEYDSGMALIDLQDAQHLFRMDNGVTGVRLKLKDMFRAPQVSAELRQRIPGFYLVTDWTQQHANFFKAIRTEKTVMFIILLLIVAVAAFNIVSTLVMVVTDKEADIAILRTLGATPRTIMAVFMVQGTLIGFFGTLLGVICGVLLSLNVETIVPAIERTFGVHFLPASVYYISELPSRLEWSDVLHIGVIAFVLSVLATIYPAWRASRTQPAEALRYE